jgi:hypothetical protein
VSEQQPQPAVAPVQVAVEHDEGGGDAAPECCADNASCQLHDMRASWLLLLLLGSCSCWLLPRLCSPCVTDSSLCPRHADVHSIADGCVQLHALWLSVRGAQRRGPRTAGGGQWAHTAWVRG